MSNIVQGTIAVKRPDAIDTIKSPYTFEFLGLKSQDVVYESTLEQALIDHLEEFMLELGHGFCFEAKQKRIIIGDRYYFCDLVFYNRVLKCHVLVELKVGEFAYEHTLHMDETTPHIHASVVPIVTGERRQKKPKKESEQKPEEEKAKRKYKKKEADCPRLCCDDVMAKAKLIEYQDSYAEAMRKYGLERGIKGSEARHITLTEFYRNQAVECKNLQENIGLLLAMEDTKQLNIEQLKRQEEEAKQKSQQAEKLKLQKELELKKTEENLNQIKRQLKTEKFKGVAAEVGSTLMDGISSALGTSKGKRQQQEIGSLKSDNESLVQEIRILKQDMQTMLKEHESTVNKLKQEINKICNLFPHIRKLLRIENLLKVLNFGEDLIKSILQFKPVGFKGSLYSPEHKRSFSTEYSVAEVKEDTKQAGKFQLLIDKLDSVDWFRQKQQEFLKSIGINVKERTKVSNNKGVKL